MHLRPLSPIILLDKFNLNFLKEIGKQSIDYAIMEVSPSSQT